MEAFVPCAQGISNSGGLHRLGVQRRCTVLPVLRRQFRAIVRASAEEEDRAAEKKAVTPAPASEGVTDLYQSFWDYANEQMRKRLPDLGPYPIPKGFEKKEQVSGKGARSQWVRTTSYGFQTEKLRQIRAAHVQGGKSLQVLNFVIFPDLKYRLPFFGADLVTLPGGHLIALDMQPLFHTDEYKKEFYDALLPIHAKHQQGLPWGGDFPEEAKTFFSPCFIWTRPSEDEKVQHEVFEAFKEYLDMYLSYVDEAQEITDPEELVRIQDSQTKYLKYRAEKDPARGMFQRFYGPEWTEEYIHGFLFDLEEKIKSGEYVPPASLVAK